LLATFRLQIILMIYVAATPKRRVCNFKFIFFIESY